MSDSVWAGADSLVWMCTCTRRTTYNILNATHDTLHSIRVKGKCRAIGVSNYDERHLKELLASCKIKPMVDQLEHHPRLQRESLQKFCKDNGIVFEAYTSLGDGKVRFVGL